MNPDLCEDECEDEDEQMQSGEVASKFRLSSITSGKKLLRRSSTMKLNPWTQFIRDEKVQDDPVQYYTTHVYMRCGTVLAKTSDMYESFCRKQSASNGTAQPKYRG